LLENANVYMDAGISVKNASTFRVRNASEKGATVPRPTPFAPGLDYVHVSCGELDSKT